MTPRRRARVRIDGEPVGWLTEGDDGVEFRYLESWLARADAVPVSLTLPLRSEPVRSRSLHPFFENLLPEGWLLDLSTARLKIAKDDAFGLLLATCRDCIGAVEVLPDDETGEAS
ncbi:MAG: HipA N-terminal domain-containing protein [Planctomycetota bacterium JB042]